MILVTYKNDRNRPAIKPHFPRIFMLRVTTVAIISIVSLLSIANISDAKSIKKASTSQVTGQSKSYSVAKQSKIPSRNISESDLTNIQKVISERYARKNQLLEDAASNSRRFYEVKSLRLISFSNTKAQIEVEENIRGYDFVNAGYISRQKPGLFDKPASEYIKHVFNLNLEKSAGKWKINTQSK